MKKLHDFLDIMIGCGLLLALFALFFVMLGSVYCAISGKCNEPSKTIILQQKDCR